MDIELAESASGADQDIYWVTLGFESEDSSLDTLHIVCGRVEDLEPGFQGLYFERLDQGMSDYDLADSILVSSEAVTIKLNARGIETLRLPADLRFLLPNDPARRERLTETFRQMAETPNGGVLRFQEA